MLNYHQPDAREHYQYCLRRAQQVHRHQDSSYRTQTEKLSLQDALRVYGEVLARLRADYVEADKVELSQLFRQGLEELRLTLSDDAFCQAFLDDVSIGSIRDFQARLFPEWGDKLIRRADDATAAARDVALAASKALGLRPTLVVLELACGACRQNFVHGEKMSCGCSPPWGWALIGSCRQMIESRLAPDCLPPAMPEPLVPYSSESRLRGCCCLPFSREAKVTMQMKKVMSRVIMSQ